MTDHLSDASLGPDPTPWRETHVVQPQLDSFHFTDCGIAGGWPHPASAHDDDDPQPEPDSYHDSDEYTLALVAWRERNPLAPHPADDARPAPDAAGSVAWSPEYLEDHVLVDQEAALDQGVSSSALDDDGSPLDDDDDRYGIEYDTRSGHRIQHGYCYAHQSFDCSPIERILAIPHHWTFKDAAVAGAFDDHVREQLPWYDLVTGAVAQVIRHYLPEGGVVYDLGASTGNVGRSIAQDLEERHATLIAVDNSPDMLDVYAGPGTPVLSTAEDFILARHRDGEQADVVVAFLSLMFTPMSQLADLVELIRESILKPGGAFVVVDRLAPDDGYAGMVKSRLTLAGKLAAGATPDEIITKELSLAGVQRPLPPWLLGDGVEFFRFADFVGILIERSIG